MSLGIFDLLYAPQSTGPIASFPDRPLFAKDVGDLIASVRGEPTVAVSISGGPKAGRKAVFHLMPQNREFAPSMGALEITIDGKPVICNINMGQYGLNSALTNTMCFEDGGVLTNGQYLNGAVAPESCAVIRRCLIDERYLYAHIVVTFALDPKLCVRQADRLFVLDRKTGVIVLSDSFHGDRAIRFATHLHCSGSVTELGNRQYRLTGGQANLIAGIKGGNKGLDDAEAGEIFVQILNSLSSSRVVVEEPSWVPGYIYGLNNTGLEDISEGRFPRYHRWRLEACEPVQHGSFLMTLGPRAGPIHYVDGAVILPDGGCIRFGYATLSALGVQCDCESLLWDDTTHRIMAMGLRRLLHGASELAFPVPVDMTYNADEGVGTLYAQGPLAPASTTGFRLDPWRPTGQQSWKTHNTSRAAFSRTVRQRNRIGGGRVISEKSIEVAILGSGQMGENILRHLQDSPLVRGITLFDLHAARMKQLQQNFGVKSAATLEQVLEDPEIKLVFITASNNAHKDLTVAALEAGKAVMCEKPMATTLADAEAMVEAAERTKGFLQVGFELRYSHLYTTVKGWVDEGLLGRVLNAQCTYLTSAWGRDAVWRVASETSGGMFGEKLSHYVDLVRWWVGDTVEEVYATCAPNVISYYEVHDNYHCTFRFKQGAVGHLTFMMGPASTFKGDPLQNAVSQQAGDGHMLRYMIYGKKGAAETDVFPRTIKRWEFGETDYGQTSAWLQNETWDPEQDFAYFHNTHDQALDIVRRVVEGEPPSINPRDALETTRLCFAAELSATERRPVRLDELK